jgi:hypothetical protein
LFVRNSYVFLKFYKICGGSVIKQRNLYSGLLLYLSITEMLGIDVEQCSWQRRQGSLKGGDGGIVGSLVLKIASIGGLNSTLEFVFV